jgi:hypothetical protein
VEGDNSRASKKMGHLFHEFRAFLIQLLIGLAVSTVATAWLKLVAKFHSLAIL